MPSRSRSSKNATKKQQASSAPQRRLDPNSISGNAGFLDDWARRDIAGIVFILLAIVTMLMAVIPENDAVVSGAGAAFMHMAFGKGAYILPFVLAVIGATFLFRSRKRRISLRAAIGLALIFVALLGFIALFTPISNIGEDDPALLFSPQALPMYGGYIGAAIAWAGMMLFGKTITGVILIGLMVIGIVVIGFSISKMLESIRIRSRSRIQQLREERSLGSASTPQFARIRQRKNDDPRYENVLPDASGAASPGNFIPIAPGAAAIANAPVDPDVTYSFVDMAKRNAVPSGNTSAMTRKLGAKPVQDAAIADKPAKKPSSRSSQTQKNNLKPQEGFVLPPMSLLRAPDPAKGSKANEDELADTAVILQDTLEDFGIGAKVVGWVAGPTVTLFKVELPSGLRVSRVMGLNADLALALATPAVRIFAPIPGTNYVGIEVPNKERQTVLLSEVLSSASSGPLQIAIGKDVEGEPIVSDLSKMPHLLIGGTTGSGKSVSINAMIMSILMRATPAEVRLIMIDPKRVEFTPYNGIPHLYIPVVTEPKEAASALAWGVAEMERRLKMFSKVGARNIDQYNEKVNSGEMASEDDPSPEQVPYIVIIIDELADLMMAVGKEVEFSICRIAQLARAAGIHLIVATQRPSTNVVTGLIKSNITNRIAFNVASSIDSRVILDTTGAEDLIGLGDLLLSKPELARPQRIQGCFVSEEEINSVVEMIKQQGEPDYHKEILNTNVMSIGDTSPSGGSGGDFDPLLWEAADIVVASGSGSTSNIQRRLKVGYARAGRIMDQLEEKGIVGPSNGSRPREVYVDELELESLRAFEENDE